MKTIAIPIYGNRISNRLDTSENIVLVSTQDGVIKKREMVRLLQTNAAEKINTLIKLGVDVLICDGITEFYSNTLKHSPIQVIPWVSGEFEEMLSQYLKGKLSNQNTSSEGE